MKKNLTVLMALLLVCLMACSALAVVKVLTEVPVTPTQDEVLNLTASWRDESKTAYDVKVMAPDQLTMDTVDKAYHFVYEDGNRPARFFPEKTQQEIITMYPDVDLDSLYITEMMRLHAAKAVPQTDQDMVMLLDVDYQPGQHTVVVLGDTTDPEQLEWTPVESEVTALGQVECHIPKELIQQMQGEDVLFSLLSGRLSPRGDIVKYEKKVIHIEVPSKSAYDIVVIKKIVLENEDANPDDFQLIITAESDPILRELSRIRTQIKEKHLPLSDFLPEAIRNEMQQLLGENAKLDQLVIYDYLSLITEDYDKAFGDAMASFSFATLYTPGQQIITLLGLPKENEDEKGDITQMEWLVQRAEVAEEATVETLFSQLTLDRMDEEVGLLLVLSAPIQE